MFQGMFGPLNEWKQPHADPQVPPRPARHQKTSSGTDISPRRSCFSCRGASSAGPNRAPEPRDQTGNRHSQHRDCRPSSGCGAECGEGCGEGYGEGCRMSAGRDTGKDAGRDATTDVGRDAGRDTGKDAGRNARKDAPPPRAPAPAVPRGTHRRRGSLRGLVAPRPRSESSAGPWRMGSLKAEAASPDGFGRERQNAKHSKRILTKPLSFGSFVLWNPQPAWH